jgi:hypothetical protein
MRGGDITNTEPQLLCRNWDFCEQFLASSGPLGVWSVPTGGTWASLASRHGLLRFPKEHIKPLFPRRSRVKAAGC